MVKIWKTASRNEKCIVTGDLNFDFAKWMDPDPRHSNMVDLMKSEIEVEGFFQLIKEYTRTWPNQEDSIVDHVWSNSVDRVISHMNCVRAGSDHNTISVRVRMKDRAIAVQVVEKRMRKNLDNEKLINDLKKVDWSGVLLSNNVDKINGALEKDIRAMLDSQDPVKIIQVRKGYRSLVNSDLKSKMTQRDSLREIVRRSEDPGDWAAYRQSRNETSKEIKTKQGESFFKTSRKIC